ncbi:MAG TPA: toll/interleukin-1 receptor domain-containing protein, partial [Longimicrobium sp.]|nr:toll/interleukin-1 receptor domain-containing protein [Longimicrobium sp.]
MPPDLAPDAGPQRNPQTLPGRSARAGLLSWIRRLFTGDDVFISYSRADASDYALELADRLTRSGLSCFLDLWGTEPNRELPGDLVRALHNSGALVVLASPAAARSRFVGEEVALF